MRRTTADRSGVGGHSPETQSHATEDALIRIEHDLIARQRTRRIPVKGIGVLHRELAASHDAEPGPTFVAELGLDVPEIFRQLAPGPNLGARNIGHHLL